MPGGFWLGDASSKPTFAWSANLYRFVNGLEVQNLLQNLMIDGRIVTSFSNFDVPPSPVLYDFAVLLFIIYYSSVLCLYPGFYALYPTLERLRNVRALQYSNGVKPLSLWLTHVLFDLRFTLVMSIVSTVLLSSELDYGETSCLTLAPYACSANSTSPGQQHLSDLNSYIACRD